jgi:hypothetical protein
VRVSKDIQEEIELLSEKRAALWADGQHGEEAKSIGEKIAALYDLKRRETAPHGSESDRKKAIKRAKAEDELDRLMTS